MVGVQANKSHIRVHHGKPKRVHRCLTLHSDQSFASARLLETHRLSAHPTTHYCTRLGCCHAFASQVGALECLWRGVFLGGNGGFFGGFNSGYNCVEMD